MSSYPAEPFKKVDALLRDLIDSYQHADDCSVVAEVRESVATTIHLAAQREGKVQECIRGLTSRVADLEGSGGYSPSRSGHQRRIEGLEQAIQETLDRVAKLRDDIRDASDQQQHTQAAEDELKGLCEKLEAIRKTEEPRVNYQVSLYAHITRMAFQFGSVDQPVKQATVCNMATGDIVPVSFDLNREPAYDLVNRMWENIKG